MQKMNREDIAWTLICSGGVLILINWLLKIGIITLISSLMVVIGIGLLFLPMVFNVE